MYSEPKNSNINVLMISRYTLGEHSFQRVNAHLLALNSH